jgi:hypothetical protein
MTYQKQIVSLEDSEGIQGLEPVLLDTARKKKTLTNFGMTIRSSEFTRLFSGSKPYIPSSTFGYIISATRLIYISLVHCVWPNKSMRRGTSGYGVTYFSLSASEGCLDHWACFL